jgi:uncharacterized membrane protein
MSKHVQWLREQLELWVSGGLLSRDQADRIRAQYPEGKTAAPWGMILFSGLGSALLGLGVILLLAYNWHAIPRGMKLATILGAVASSHVLGLIFLRHEDWRRQLGDVFTVLGSMLFGAGIWLIAQIYHIDEHFPNGFLLWGSGALLMAWAVPSVAQGILAVIVLCVWNCVEAWRFDAAIEWGPAGMALLVGTLAWRRRSRLLLFVMLAGFSLSWVATTSAVSGKMIIPGILCLSALWLALNVLLPRHGWFAQSAPVWEFFGWMGLTISTYLLSFHGIADDLLGWRRGSALPDAGVLLVHIWAPFVLALVAWGVVAVGALRRTEPWQSDVTMELWLAPLAAVAAVVFSASDWMAGQGGQTLIAGLFNMVALALAATWMARGCREARLRPTVLGSLLLAVLAAGRYFDLFQNLAARGMVFLLVGGLLFAEGILYSRARRRVQTEEAR